MDTNTSEFVTAFHRLRDEVLAHASAEEASAFPILETATTEAERLELGTKYEKAKDKAPTHPHPHAPDTPPGNKCPRAHRRHLRPGPGCRTSQLTVTPCFGSSARSYRSQREGRRKVFQFAPTEHCLAEFLRFGRASPACAQVTAHSH